MGAPSNASCLRWKTEDWGFGEVYVISRAIAAGFGVSLKSQYVYQSVWGSYIPHGVINAHGTVVRGLGTVCFVMQSKSQSACFGNVFQDITYVCCQGWTM